MKTNKIIEKPKETIVKNTTKAKDITYEILSNDSTNDKQISTIETNNKNKMLDSIPINGDFPVKMILGSPEKIRSTCARLIKAGAKGLIPMATVNSMIWQLRSLVYFDTVNADLTIYNKILALEKQVKQQEKERK